GPAGMAFAACRREAAACGLALAGARVGVVGARGSVGGLCARLFARARPRRLLLVGNPAAGRAALEALRTELEWAPGTVAVTTELAGLAGGDIVVSATRAARPGVDAPPPRPGTLRSAAARPPDAPARLRARADLCVVDGGLVALPDPGACFGAGNLVGLPAGVQLACLSETILLALAGDCRDHGVGDAVPLAEVDYLMDLA